jgi:protein lifeguard
MDLEAQSEYQQSLGKHLSLQIRHNFVSKVFSIVGVQLFVTAGIAALFRTALTDVSPGIVWLAFLSQIGFLLTMMCFPSTLHKFPLNYALLAAYTLLQGFMTGCLCARYDQSLVITAICLTAVIVISIAALATQTKYDMTGKGGYLFAAGLGLIFAVLLLSCFPSIKINQRLIAAAFLLLFSVYLVYDIQLITGGDHRKFQFTVDQYILAALVLYMDIIAIFQTALQLLGSRNN